MYKGRNQSTNLNWQNNNEGEQVKLIPLKQLWNNLGISGNLVLSGCLDFVNTNKSYNITSKDSHLILSSSLGSIVSFSSSLNFENLDKSYHIKAINSDLIIGNYGVVISGSRLAFQNDTGANIGHIVTRASDLVLKSNTTSIVAISGNSLHFTNDAISQGSNILARNSYLILSSGLGSNIAISGTTLRFSTNQNSTITANAGNSLSLSGSDVNIYTTLNLFPKNSTIEGGEICLRGAGDYETWYLDRFMGAVRFFSASTTHFWLDKNGLQVGNNGELELARFQLDVREDKDSAWGARIYNSGSTAGRCGLFIQCGKNAPSSNSDIYWIGLGNGNGSDVTYIEYYSSSPYARFVAASDERLKENISPTKIEGLKIINNIPLYEFEWKDKRRGKENMGYVAQTLLDVCPEMVGQKDGMYTVGDSCLTKYLVKAIQEQQVQIEELKKIIKDNYK